jgi:UrcA family protein
VKTMTQPLRFGTVIATLILGALATGVAAVNAAEDSDIPKIVVKYDDLNVSAPQGAAVLFRRIRRAGETLCGSLAGGGLGPKMRMNACVQNAIAEAVTKVNQPQLFAIYKANYKTPSPTTLLSQNR